MNKHLTCENCGEITETEFINKIIRHLGNEVLAENLEAEVCQKCGERYFSGKVLLELENQIEKGEIQKAA